MEVLYVPFSVQSVCENEITWIPHSNFYSQLRAELHCASPRPYHVFLSCGYCMARVTQYNVSIRSYLVCIVPMYGKVQEGNDQKRHNQKEIPTPKTEVGKTKLTIRYLYLENISKAERAAISK